MRSCLALGILCVIAILVTGMASYAQDYSFYEDFDDGDITGNTSGGRWDGWDGVLLDARTGDLVVSTQDGFKGVTLVSVDGDRLAERTEWSFRARMTVQSGDFAAVGTTVFNHASLSHFSATDARLRVGTNFDFDTAVVPAPTFGEEFLIQMDSFDGVITGSIWKDGDLDSLIQQTRPYSPSSSLPMLGVGQPNVPATVTFHEAWISSSAIPVGELPVGDVDFDGQLTAKDVDLIASAIRSMNDNSIYDIDGDRLVTAADHNSWVKDIKDTWFGDANLDGEFNSSDLVEVFQADKYELDVDANWAEGDWNGDGRFGSKDMIVAFQDGGYERGPRGAANAVPEPACAVLLGIGVIGLCRFRRSR